MTNDELLVYTNSVVPIPPTRSCNRHFDCKEAEDVYHGKHPKEPKGYIPNFHCHDDECEDCFGC